MPNAPHTPTVDWPMLGGVGALAAASIAILITRRGALSGTTLVGPWRWSLSALVAVAAAEIAAQARLTTAGMADHLRFAAGLATLCPWMALLGAKRPQNRGWPWIVASLWLVLVWPLAEAMLYRPDRPLSIHPLRQWFLLGLWGTCLLNGLPTRHALAALLAAGGQACLLATHFPALPAVEWRAMMPTGGTATIIGLACIAAACWLWAVRLCPRRADRNSFDRVWLDFRDLYGGIWGMRVAERFNAAAAICGWHGRLRWGGLVRASPTGQEATEIDDLPAPLRQALHSLLTRFVSEAWIAERWPALVD
jgi:hypothetical protein